MYKQVNLNKNCHTFITAMVTWHVLYKLMQYTRPLLELDYEVIFSLYSNELAVVR